LEGRNADLFQAVESLAHTEPGGPTYPTLGKRLFSSLDAAEYTMKALGKKPTPEEVDRSNLRRLIRATEPLMETYRDCYEPKDFKKAKKELKAVARALGQYKDIAVIEAEVAATNGGTVPTDIAKAIAKSRKKRAKGFEEAYKRFRKKGLPRAGEILRQPRIPGVPDPQKLLREDKSRLTATVSDHLDQTRQLGLEHKDPENFHAARKSLRATLNAINAADRAVAVDGEAISEATGLVDAYGKAQDAHIAENWLTKKGFKDQASKLAQRHDQLQRAALSQADGFSLDRLKPRSDTPALNILHQRSSSWASVAGLRR
jgi:CHAD domain-containing protein